MAHKPAIRAQKPPRKPKSRKGVGGRPKWVPTKEERLLVEVAVGAGYSQQQIATLIGKSEDSLQRHCREELDIGAIKAGTKISGALYSKAMKGDVAAIIWWEKTRRRLSDRMTHEFDLSKLTDEELEALERIRSRIAQP